MGLSSRFLAVLTLLLSTGLLELSAQVPTPTIQIPPIPVAPNGTSYWSGTVVIHGDDTVEIRSFGEGTLPVDESVLVHLRNSLPEIYLDATTQEFPVWQSDVPDALLSKVEDLASECPLIGIYVQDVGPFASFYGDKLSDEPIRDGMAIESIIPGTGAEEAGLLAGDILKQVDGVEVGNFANLRTIVRSAGVGADVVLLIEREGENLLVPTTIGKSPFATSFDCNPSDPYLENDVIQGSVLIFSTLDNDRNQEASSALLRQLDVGERARLGTVVQSVHPQLAAYLGLSGSETGAVHISEVVDGSPAERADLRAGDIILSVDGRQLDGPFALVREVREAESAISLEFLRDGERLTRTVRLTEEDSLDSTPLPYDDINVNRNPGLQAR